MSRTRSLSRTLIAVTAATAPVITLAPSAHAAPQPQPPRTPLGLLPSAPALPASPALPAAPAPTAPVLPTVEQGVTRWVSVPVANVRSGPSTSYRVVGTRSLGAKVQGTVTSNGWLKISDTQYMAPSVVSSSQPGTNTQADTMWLDVAVGNVRSGPGLGYRVVDTMTYGQKALGSWVNGWLKVGEGRYVSGTILTSSNPDGGSSAETVTRWVSVPVANVRRGPSTSYAVVGTKTMGTEVRGTIGSNGWLKISDTQHMAPSVLGATDPGGNDGGTTKVDRWVSVPVANVRSGPSTAHQVVGTKTQGSAVSGVVSTNGWLRISTTQYMAPSVLTPDAPAAAPAPPPPSDPAPSTPVREAVLATAASYVGYPYVLYGTPPNAFDCSSYTWWVFKQHGINIPRTVRDQRTVVTPVSEPQPGDLVFYTKWYHVAIYAGNGMVYDARNPSTGVMYGPMLQDPGMWYGRVPGL
ncbi:SH3 domain-containing protein [Ornithinimicrobium avium]|uniref:NlpC/P60 domain-containing protein n=1 Tax=Ornithinimicrobium avium TaxID=2283195 RepID=A0A345NPY0_9MICO|nr:NlpC/P60 family protein [Ornithinimicrobium avium]AXH97088.1 hypothetical protein DV701_14045 [Ornithinimicrobium avium]